MANDSHYGLAAYVWSHDIGRALRAAHAIEAGWVQVNHGLGQTPGHSYGGYKESGIGREFSLEGMLESYTQRKNVTINLKNRAVAEINSGALSADTGITETTNFTGKPASRAAIAAAQACPWRRPESFRVAMAADGTRAGPMSAPGQTRSFGDADSNVRFARKMG